MNLKMKGLLKGLRYISHIFEPAEKEQEMQIGNPTDVKHVAHIGSDGPAANPPAWMNEYRSEANVEPTRKHSSQDSKPSRRNRSVAESPEGSNVPKTSRRNHGAARTGSSESSFKTNNNGEQDAPKQNRRHSKSKGDQEGTKPSRRKKNSKGSPGQSQGGAADSQ